MSAHLSCPPARPGPFEAAAWPEQLVARVVEAGPGGARIHGFDVESDLAPHYSPVETTLLSLTGELPSAAQAGAFEVALQFLAPASVREAPAHAILLARVCNVQTSAMIAAAALGLAEQARVLVAEHTGWLRALEAKEAAPGPRWASQSEDERQSVERLRRALGARGVVIPALADDLGRVPALLATLWFAGLRGAEGLESAIVLSRLPVVLAEGFATPTHARAFREYPFQLPAFVYVEPS